MLGQRQGHVERHDVVKAVIRIQVLALGIVQEALEAEPAKVILEEGHLARDIDAVELRLLIGILQDIEGVGNPDRRLDGIHVIGDIGVIGRRLNFPVTLRGMPVEGRREGIGLFRFQIDVADIAVTIAHRVVHARGHGPGGPGVALIKIGGAHQVGKAEFQVLGLVQPITGQGGQVDIVVGFLTVLGIEAVGL